MDDIYYKIQTYLQKKDQECGHLRFLTSRTTVENIRHIEEVCQSISESLETFKIPTEGPNLKDNLHCIQIFKYLLLNTAFKSQIHLMEDINNGHLADMFPPLSPYLFLEVIWYINFEEILVESILYIPLDTSVEILEICKRCCENFNFDRGFNILSSLISNGHKKLILTKNLGSQTSSFDEYFQRLINAIQELITLVSSERIIKLSEVTGLKKAERYGLVLKKLLKLVRYSLEINQIDVSEKNSVLKINTEKEKLYKITFGNQSPVRGVDGDMENGLKELNSDLTNLLLKKLQEIDFNIYLSWSELDYENQNNSVSLQRAIGIDCYSFAESLKKNDEIPYGKLLIGCLTQLSSQPDPEVPICELNLEELCKRAEDKKDYVKELMKRYKDWTESTFDCIEKNESHLDKEDCLYLLEYLHSVFLSVKQKSSQEEYEQKVHSFVTKILWNQSIIDLFSIAIDFILNHDGCNVLELPKTEENFENFIIHSSTFKSPQQLRFVLISVIKSPRKILSMLLKIVIGYPIYEHVMISPGEFFLLAPILKIRTENGKSLLMNILGDCMKDAELNVKKFAHLVQVMEENKCTADEIFNHLFIPYLESETFNVSNIKSVLNSARMMQKKCTDDLNIEGLMRGIMKRISYLRKDIFLQKYVNGEILCLLIRVIEVFDQSIWSAGKKYLIHESVNIYLEPVDRIYFCHLWRLTKQGIDIREIMDDYHRRCFIVMNTVNKQEISERLKKYLNDFSFSNENFLRHLILRTTEIEYTKFGSEIVLLYWNSFKWKNEMEAFDNFVRITIEACLLCLEFPDISSPQSFPFLLKCLSRFSKTIFKLNVTKIHNNMYEILTRNLRKLNDSIAISHYSALFIKFLSSIDNNLCKKPMSDILQQLIDAIHIFGCQCLEVMNQGGNSKYTPELIKFRIAHEIISNAIKVSDGKVYTILEKTEELLFSGDHGKGKEVESEEVLKNPESDEMEERL